MSADDARNQLIEAAAEALAVSLYGGTPDHRPDWVQEAAGAVFDALLARRDLILEALGGERTAEVPGAHEVIAWWFPVDSTETE